MNTLADISMIMGGGAGSPITQRISPSPRAASSVDDDRRESVERTLRLVRRPITLADLSAASQVNVPPLKRVVAQLETEGVVAFDGRMVTLR